MTVVLNTVRDVFIKLSEACCHFHNCALFSGGTVKIQGQCPLEKLLYVRGTSHESQNTVLLWFHLTFVMDHISNQDIAGKVLPITGHKGPEGADKNITLFKLR